jgi:hypothetical protein
MAVGIVALKLVTFGVGEAAELKSVVHCVAADEVALMHAEIMFAIRLSLFVSGVAVRVTAGLMLLL